MAIYTVLGDKVVTARKPSRCFGCLGTFPAGTEMQRVAATANGRFEQWSYCPTCREIWRRDMSPGDEIIAGEFADHPEYWESVRAEIGAPRGDGDRVSADSG